MSLVKCPDCGNMVSHRAEMCPNCGCPAEYFIDSNKDVEINVGLESSVLEGENICNNPQKPKDMTMEEFKAWCAANEARDAKEDKSNEAIMVASIMKLYGSEPDGYCINDYKEYFTEEEFAELLACKENVIKSCNDS